MTIPTYLFFFIAAGKPQESDFAFRVAFAMTLLIWTLGRLAVALAIFAG